jgi:hypothetical protein
VNSHPFAADLAIAGFTSCSGAKASSCTKKLRRLYREERMQVRRRSGRKRAVGTGLRWHSRKAQTSKPALEPGFLSDAFADGRRFRILAMVDDFTRECLDAGLSAPKMLRDGILRWAPPPHPVAPPSHQGSNQYGLYSSLDESRAQVTACLRKVVDSHKTSTCRQT